MPYRSQHNQPGNKNDRRLQALAAGTRLVNFNFYTSIAAIPGIQ
jgi:hypothetical protein